AEVGVEIFELLRQQQALIDDRPARKAGDVEPAALAECLTYGTRGPLADDVKFTLERRFVGDVRTNEHLTHERQRLAGQCPAVFDVHGYVTPAEHALPAAQDLVLEDLFGLASRRRIRGEKHETNAVTACAGQFEAQPRGLFCKKRVRDLKQQACAIAGARVTASGAAVLEVD